MTMTKQHFVTAVMVTALTILSISARAESDKKNKVFFRGGYSMLTDDRGNEVFTDTGNASGINDTKGGYSIAGGLDLGITDRNQMMNAWSLGGEIMVEFSKFSSKSVRQTTSALLGGTAQSEVNVTELNVGINPKVKFDKWGSIRPFLIPVGLAFLVSSPPSNDSTYLDLGLNFGTGVDFELGEWIVLGVDARYTLGFETNNTNTSYFSTGASVGFLF